MKLRIWRNCKVVAELEFDDETLLLIQDDTIGADGKGVDGFIEDDDHVSIDPWNLLAGETKGNLHSTFGIGLGVSNDVRPRRTE